VQEGQHISIRNKPVITHRYDIRLKNPDHWGVFFWDLEERLIIHSAWGTWSHGWDGEGKQWNADFLGRVVGRLADGTPCYDYLAGKLARGVQEFDEEATQAELKARIEAKRAKLKAAATERPQPGDLDSYPEAQLDEALEELASIETVEGAWQWGADHSIDAYHAIKMRHPIAITAMLEALWDVFVKAVREGTFTVMECPEKFPRKEST
jgi:hypothetical protein